MKAKIGYIRNNRFDPDDEIDYEETNTREFKPELNRYDNECNWTRIVYFEVEES
jgi:hypothetical protein